MPVRKNGLGGRHSGMETLQLEETEYKSIRDILYEEITFEKTFINVISPTARGVWADVGKL